MPRLRTPLLLTLAALSGWLAQAQPLPAGEDLLSIYAQARAADPLLAGARAQLGLQQAQLQESRAARLPQWSARLEQRREDAGSQQQLHSQINQVLLDLSLLRRVEAAEQALSAEQARLRAAEQALCARVASAYFGLLSAQAQLETAESNEAALAQQVAQAQARHEAGLSALVDLEQARAYHGLARGQTSQARRRLLDAREALAEITGRRPERLQPLREQFEPQPPEPADPQAWAAQTLQGNPQLLALQRGVAASELGLAAAAAAHLPSLSLQLDGQRHSGAGLAPEMAGRSLNTLSLRLNIPLFAGGALQARQQQALQQRELLREQLEVQRRALLRETQVQYQAVLSGIEELASSAAAAQAAERALAATRAGQALGTRSMTDLLLALQTQAQARMNQAQARHSYVLATLLLQLAVGGLGEAQLARVNQLLQGAS